MTDKERNEIVRKMRYEVAKNAWDGAIINNLPKEMPENVRDFCFEFFFLGFNFAADALGACNKAGLISLNLTQERIDSELKNYMKEMN